MDVLNNEVLTMLIQERQGPCISIYTPTHREWNELNQDMLRYKNQLRQAENLLAGTGMKKGEIEKFLQNAYKLADDREFWNHQQEGLAVFTSPTEFYYLRTPFNFRERLYMNSRFYTKHLLPVFNGDKEFFILSLDVHNIRLFRSRHYSIREIDLGNIPVNIDDALGLDTDYEKKMQFRAEISTGNTHRANFHGHGARNESTMRKRDIFRFYEMVNNGLINILKNERAPLILAGVEQAVPLFKEANKYPNLYENYLKVDADYINWDDLYHRAEALLEPLFEKDKLRELERFGNLIHSDKASGEPGDIIKAAFENRIAVLLLNPEEEIWGRFDVNTFEVVVNYNKQEGDVDLVDLAATQTLLKNGTIYNLDKEKMPEGRSMAAIYRF